MGLQQEISNAITVLNNANFNRMIEKASDAYIDVFYKNGGEWKTFLDGWCISDNNKIMLKLHSYAHRWDEESDVEVKITLDEIFDLKGAIASWKQKKAAWDKFEQDKKAVSEELGKANSRLVELIQAKNALNFIKSPIPVDLIRSIEDQEKLILEIEQKKKQLAD